MKELQLGDPLDPATDIGPVIDAGAQNMLASHIDTMTHSAKLVAATPLDRLPPGHFIAPHAFEIPSIALLPGEVFGPVLHIIRSKQRKLPGLQAPSIPPATGLLSASTAASRNISICSPPACAPGISMSTAA